MVFLQTPEAQRGIEVISKLSSSFLLNFTIFFFFPEIFCIEKSWPHEAALPFHNDIPPS